VSSTILDPASRVTLEPRTAGDHPVFLLGFDLEDVRSMIPGGSADRDAVPRTTERFLELLERHAMRATFFVVGDVARRHPALIREIAERGHELACHSSDHVPLDRHDRSSFRADIERNRDDLVDAGAPPPLGFRAPMFSLTPRAEWAYDVLAELGFRYSSSVLPRSHPLYGWQRFGEHPIRTDGGIWEIPISTGGVGRLGIPFAGGVYFRLLPLTLVRAFFGRRRGQDAAVVGNLHRTTSTSSRSASSSRPPRPTLDERAHVREPPSRVVAVDAAPRRGLASRALSRLCGRAAGGAHTDRGVTSGGAMEHRRIELDPAGIEEVSELLGAAFPQLDFMTPRYLTWSYRENPDGEAFGFNAYDRGRIAAHYVTQPLRAVVDGQPEAALLSLHTGTRPEYQGRGLFTELARRTFAAAAEAGYGHVIGVANASSTPGFLRKLGFQLVAPLDVRVGLGPAPRREAGAEPRYRREWSEAALRWRLGCPVRAYRSERRDGELRVLAPTGRFGIWAELASVERAAQAALPPLGFRPLRLWLGLDSGRRFGGTPYVMLPDRLRPCR
jgi:polysaccharide deacetylase family protein (PEP-CTERM system associated)